MDLPIVEVDNVQKIYSKISNDFSKTRYKVWPNVEKFINQFPMDTKFLEIGCGNGKNMLIRPDKFKGCDICEEFVNMCKDKNLNVVKADATDLPYEDNIFDVTISVAVIHHLSTEERRLKAIKEMLRVTKTGGKILIEVWGLEGNNKALGPDTMVPWKMNDMNYERYYHFFSKEEITRLVSSCDGCSLDNVLWEKFNWILHITKN